MKKKKQKPSWGTPGAWAIARNQAGGDWAAACLLYRLKYYFQPEKSIKRLTRLGKEWIAMSRDQWAKESGLSVGEMKNRALPRLRKMSYVSIMKAKLKYDAPNLLWMSLDLVKLFEATQPDEIFEYTLNGGTGPGYENPGGNYPYKKSEF